MPAEDPPIQKPVYFFRSSLKDLRAFPEAVQQKAGFLLDRVQRGLTPQHVKPLSGVGGGTYELKIDEAGDTYRVVYVVKLEEAVYVLDAFQKKSPRGRRLPRNIQDRLRRRYQEVKALRPARQRRRS